MVWPKAFEATSTSVVIAAELIVVVRARADSRPELQRENMKLYTYMYSCYDGDSTVVL